jgi:hypothetical protein
MEIVFDNQVILDIFWVHMSYKVVRQEIQRLLCEEAAVLAGRSGVFWIQIIDINSEMVGE